MAPNSFKKRERMSCLWVENNRENEKKKKNLSGWYDRTGFLVLLKQVFCKRKGFHILPNNKNFLPRKFTQQVEDKDILS